MKRCCTIILIVCSISLPTDASILSNVGEVKNILGQIDSAQALSNVSSDMAIQGTSGQGVIPNDVLDIDSGMLNGAGGVAVEATQRQPWSLVDEYSYALRKDYASPMELFRCMEYSIVGSCLSVRWTIWGPKFTFSLAVEHYVRDVHTEVVPQAPTESITSVPPDTILPSSNSVAEDIAMVYPYTWKIARELGSSLLTGGISSNLEEAQGQSIRNKKNKFLYSDAQVSGNLERHFFDSLAGSIIGVAGYCQSPTLPGISYFNSSLDQFSWRWLATTETVTTALYQMKYLEWNDVGSSYGSTFPRTGYMDSFDRFHTSVTTAIRATNIAAENRMIFNGAAGLHIYAPLPQYASSSFIGSKYQTPQDAKAFKLDMIYPYEGERCTRYGANQSWLNGMSPSKQLAEQSLSDKFTEQNPNNTAIFKIYRPFRCCRKNGNKVYDYASDGGIGYPK